MDPESLLKDKIVLTVDDESDVTDTVAEVLDMCLVRKANDYDTARQLLMSYTFDIVILDIKRPPSRGGFLPSCLRPMR